MSNIKKIITVKVTPNAKENNIYEEKDLLGNIIYKIKTTAIAKNNKANNAIINMLAKYFACTKSSIKIIRGFNTKLKLIELDKL